MSGDVKEYLAQVERHKKNMVTAIESDTGVRVPPDIIATAVAQVEGAYKTVEVWIKYRASLRSKNL